MVDDLITQRAYVIFYDEVKKHIEHAEGALRAAVPGQSSADQVLDTLRINMHKVKGGSGFFGLTELARTAGEMEEILKLPLKKNTIAKLRQLLASLTLQAANMPLPSADK
jgi:chemotaxis protein histidine kinase CheA